jgi:phenylpyruvate tautomerase PptA (4-oxalocrotonate tautomerase family)
LPLIRIDLRKGKPAVYRRAIGDSVHQALVEAYNVPADDRFQVIAEHDEDGLIYDAHYLGIERSEDVVFIHVTAGKWRDVQIKQKFYKRLVELLSVRPGLRPEDVQVVISSNDKEDWSFGNGLASYVKATA